VNITRIESRPTNTNRGTFDFFVDFNGRVDDEKVKGLLKCLTETLLIQNLLILDEKKVNSKIGLSAFGCGQKKS